MKKLLFILIIFIIVSCHSSNYTVDDIANAYFSYRSKNKIGYVFRLTKDPNNRLDSTCTFKRDYHVALWGKWIARNDSIFIEYKTKKDSIYPYVTEIIDKIKEKDTVIILSKNRIRVKSEKKVLKRRND